MSIRDIINKMPSNESDLEMYIKKNYKGIDELTSSNPNYQSSLESAVHESFSKYQPYLEKSKNKLAAVGHGVGHLADAWFLGTGDIVGTLGGKALNLISQIPEKAYGLLYGVKTGNYWDAAKNILQGVASYLPGFTWVDEGLHRIVQKRMVKHAIKGFEERVGSYEPWTAKYATQLSKYYTDVKDRAKNVFTPDYVPQTA